jgi:hypothetical protein
MRLEYIEFDAQSMVSDKIKVNLGSNHLGHLHRRTEMKVAAHILGLMISLTLIPEMYGAPCITATEFEAAEWSSGGLEGSAPAGATVDITYSTSLGPKTVHTVADSSGHYRQSLPAAVSKTTATLESAGCPPGGTTTITLASERFQPPQNTVLTQGTFLPGSSIMLAGTTVDVVGMFSAKDLAVDYDPESPTYGDLTGILIGSQFLLTGDSGGTSFALNFDADQPYTINLLPVWNASDPNGSSIPFSVPIAGMATVGLLTSPVVGTATGSVAFFTDNTEYLSLDLDLASAFGPIVGNIQSHNVETLMPIAEPNFLMLDCVALLVIAAPGIKIYLRGQ